MIQSKTLLLILLLVGITIIGLSFTTVWSKFLRPTTASELQSELRHEVKQGAGAAGEGWEHVDVKLRFDIEHPQVVAREESFIVTARCEVVDASVSSVMLGPRLQSKTTLDVPKEKLTERVSQLFGGPEHGSKAKVGIELLMAGAEIAPAAPQTGSLGSGISWSVRSTSKGTLMGVIKIAWLDEEPNPGERWALDVDENNFFRVEVTDRIWNVANVSTWFARFVGTLLTIPAFLISVWGAVRGKKLPEQPRSQLILPGSDRFS
jgi:hypothetical protein